MFIPADFSDKVRSRVYSAHPAQQQSHPIRQSFSNVIPFPNCPVPTRPISTAIAPDRTSNESLESVTTDPTNSNLASLSAQELRLTAFIRSAHQIAQSGKYPSEVVMPLLNRAWETQQLLWQLRQ